MYKDKLLPKIKNIGLAFTRTMSAVKSMISSNIDHAEQMHHETDGFHQGFFEEEVLI